MYNAALWPAFIGIARAEIFIFCHEKKKLLGKLGLSHQYLSEAHTKTYAHTGK